MFQRNSLHGNGAVLEDHFVLARVDGVEDNLVLAIVRVVLQERREQTLQVRLGIDMHRLRALEHTQGRQQTDQAEAMVTMQVGDKDIIQPPGV